MSGALPWKRSHPTSVSVGERRSRYVARHSRLRHDFGAHDCGIYYRCRGSFDAPTSKLYPKHLVTEGARSAPSAFYILDCIALSTESSKIQYVKLDFDGSDKDSSFKSPSHRIETPGVPAADINEFKKLATRVIKHKPHADQHRVLHPAMIRLERELIR